MYYIYCLTCPYTGNARYIGVSKDPNKRFKSHINKKHSVVGAWICLLHAAKMGPGFVLLSAHQREHEAYKLEKVLIRQFEADGFHLLNKRFNPNTWHTSCNSSQGLHTSDRNVRVT